MGFFSNLFGKSSFFTSEYTDKAMMSLAEVMNAHANWKSRLQKFMDGTLGYNLDPEMLAQADDTELGRWILQNDSLSMSDERRELFKQLHAANSELHQVASTIARHVRSGNQAVLALDNEELALAARQVMLLLRELGKEN